MDIKAVLKLAPFKMKSVDDLSAERVQVLCDLDSYIKKVREWNGSHKQPTLTDFVTYESAAFNFDLDGKTMTVSYKGDTSSDDCAVIRSVVLSDGVEHLIFGEGISSILGLDVRDNESLSTIYFPDSLVTLGKSVDCYKYPNLSMVSIPDTFKDVIEDYALFKDVYVEIRKPQFMEEYEDFCDFADAVVKGECTPSSSVEVAGIVVEGYGNGFYSVEAIDDVAKLPPDVVPKDAIFVIIKDGIEVLGERCLSDHVSLRFCRLPNTLEIIGEYALSGCPKLEVVAIPRSCVRIEYGAFQWCGNLKRVLCDKYSQLERIEEHVCEFCTTLHQFYLPPSLRSIGDNAFSLTSLKWVVIPKECLDIGEFAFAMCHELESVTFLYKIGFTGGSTYLNDKAFARCTRLSTVKGIYFVRSRRPFLGCTRLYIADIPCEPDFDLLQLFPECDWLHYGVYDGTRFVLETRSRIYEVLAELLKEQEGEFPIMPALTQMNLRRGNN